MTRRTLETGADCPIEVTLDIIGGKWKGMVLHRLLLMSDWGERYLE